MATPSTTTHERRVRMRSFILATDDGTQVGEFKVPKENCPKVPHVIVWQTRVFERSHHILEGDVYVECVSYFMPPQFEQKP